MKYLTMCMEECKTMDLGQDLPTFGEVMASEIPTGKKFPSEMDLT
jgi:hypothetical protein